MKRNSSWLKSLPHAHRSCLARIVILQRRDARLHGRRPTQETILRHAKQLFA